MDKNSRLQHLDDADAALSRGSTIDALRSVLAVLRANTNDGKDVPADLLVEPAPTANRKVLTETAPAAADEDELADDIANLEAKVAAARANGDTAAADKLAAQTRMVKGADTIVKAEKTKKKETGSDEKTKTE